MNIMSKALRLSVTEQTQIRILRETGFLDHFIAKRLNRSKNYVSNFVKRPRCYNPKNLKDLPRIWPLYAYCPYGA